MAIRRILINDAGNEATEIAINPGENIQCCRVQDGDEPDAYALWFFEPTDQFEDNALVGKPMDETSMKSEPVFMRFNTSAAILPIINDLAIIYGNLVKAGK